MAIRIGVVGVGFGSTVHIPAFQSEGLEVVAVCARRQERADEAAARFGIPTTFTDWEDLVAFDGIDAVSIATPVGLHRPVVLGALAAGKHVICEKPFAIDAAEAEEMWKAAQAAELTAMIAHESRFASAHRRKGELLDEGYVGSLRLALLRLVFEAASVLAQADRPRRQLLLGLRSFAPNGIRPRAARASSSGSARTTSTVCATGSGKWSR